MAFSFANVASGFGAVDGGGVQVQEGPELTEIQTDQLGFTGVNGEARVRLLSEAWPEDNLPIPSASLLSVASSQGLIAGAGPNELVIVNSEDVRNVLRATAQDNTRDITPFIKLPHTRLAHVAFSADESCLVVSPQDGGGLVAYQVDRLKSRDTQPALELATNGRGLRVISANPAVQSAPFFACITIDGELLLADLSTASLVQGPKGVVLAKNASCVTWSNKGKQLVVGLSDGTATQIKPDGTVAAQIPKAPGIADNMHVSGISWLEDNTFFVIYTPNTADLDQGVPVSEYYLITREKTQYTFQKLPEILPPFGLERVPTFHFITRLRGWRPHITDLVLLASTSATEIGMLSKASQALSSGEPVTNAFAFTTTDDDTRRAALPLSGANDTSPIGMALDLSAKEGVVNPIPADPEVEETSGPVPNVMILNNEGLLCSWWIIYNDSVRQKTTFSGFANLQTMDEARAAASPTPAAASSTQDTTTTPSQIQPTPMAEAKSSFGQPTTSNTSSFGGSGSAFGTGSAFGSTSKIGGSKSSWTSTGFSSTQTPSSAGDSAFGQPAFGQTGFGSASNAPSSRPLASSQSATTTAPAFGQTSFGSKTLGSAFGAGSALGSPFGAAGGSSGQSGFSSFAGSGGFASSPAGTDVKKSSPFAAAGSSSGQSGFSSFAGATGFGTTASGIANKSSPFGQAPQGAFGQGATTQNTISQPAATNIFGQPSTSNAFTKSKPFGSMTDADSKSAFSAAAPFKLESSFKGDGTAKDDLPKPTGPLGFGFGTGFGDLLNKTSEAPLSPTHDREEVMGEDGDDASGSEATATERATVPSLSTKTDNANTGKPTTTPPSTISQTKSTPAPPLSGIFGTTQQNDKTPQNSFGGGSWSFGNNSSTTPKETPGATKSIFGQPQSQSDGTKSDKTSDQPQTTPKALKSSTEDVPRIKTESPDEETVNISNIPEAPLPPDTLSRPDFQAGDTSLSSINSSKPDEAPLPPDFLSSSKPISFKAVDSALPGADDEEDEGFSSDFEDSGEDVTRDISPAEEGDDEDGDDDDDDEEDAEHEEDGDDAATEQLQTSPESSFKGENTTTTIASPTGGLFTKVSSNQPAHPSRPLFGEIGASAPNFPPPKPQESPRSPSPVRRLLPHDTLRSDSRSVSAPLQARSAIDQRKHEYMQSNNAAKAAQARQEEISRERARLDASSKAQAQARSNEMQSLEDNEDLRIQHELSQPVQASEHLDTFITFEPVARGTSNKVDIPAQIERLYQDINSMIYTIGINARSLESFILYQKSQPDNQSWPTVLQSETPLDALNDEWYLGDIVRLREGSSTLDQELDTKGVQDVAQKLEICQNLLSSDIVELKAKIIALRRSIYARKSGNEGNNSLSAEQSAVQHDLRTAASSVQTNLIAVEDGLSLLRARISDLQPPDTSSKRKSLLSSPKKPSVEAVTNTIAKMTSMAEKRSADVDVLEGQLRKLGLDHKSFEQNDKSLRPSTPQRNQTVRPSGTPASGASSMFYTPESRNAASARSNRSVNGRTSAYGLNMISTEDKDRWLATAKRKKEVASALRSVLVQRHSKTTVH